MGRATYGVIGVRLSGEKDDHVVAMAPVSPKFPTLLSLTSTGYGKRSPTEEYRETKRGAKGVRTIRTGGRNGSVVAVLPTTDSSELLVTTQNGITIRVAVKGIRSQSRNTLGVRVIRLDDGDQVRDAVILEAAIEGEGGDPSGDASPSLPTAELPSPDQPPEDEPDGEPDEESPPPDEEGDDAPPPAP
jgi:DNA gyrase subunit A